MPNLGPNDGADLLPLTICRYADYRPLLQAAGLAFLGERPVESGAWDELSLWLSPDDLTGSRISPASQADELAKNSPHPGFPGWRFLGLPAGGAFLRPTRARRPAAPGLVVARLECGARPGYISL